VQSYKKYPKVGAKKYEKLSKIHPKTKSRDKKFEKLSKSRGKKCITSTRYVSHIGIFFCRTDPTDLTDFCAIVLVVWEIMFIFAAEQNKKRVYDY